MGFLSKHYEKIILAGFLLVFIVALVYLIAVFSQSMEITEKDLTLVMRQADYSMKFDELGEETAEEGKKQYAALKDLSTAKTWMGSVNRDPDSPVSTDFILPIKAARCPHCEKIIPSMYFERKDNCPLCGGKLEQLAERKPDDMLKDADGDGMPDVFEIKHGLNPSDPGDKMTDLDGDGFPNYIEYLAETSPSDPKSRPPLAERLSLRGIRRNRIPLQLANVMTNNSEKKEEWLVQVQLQTRAKRWTTEFVKLGATLKLGSDIYKIADIDFKEEEQFDKRLNQPRQVNVSTITIQNTLKEGEEPIVVEIKKPVFENLIRIGLRDDHTERNFVAAIGDSIQIGDADTGMDKYVILSADAADSADSADAADSVGSGSVTIGEDKPEGKKFVIREKSALRAKIEEIVGEEQKRAPQMPHDMMMDGPQFPPMPGKPSRGNRTPPARFNPDF
ncbi:MAG: hypothetical protein JW808_02420 [Victivallales bacterium]|nr:hypothetical protein [Victivallales bacterium]